MYCRHYLAKWPTYPHIGLVDPVTGQLVKRWSGFVSSERLIDKLMEYADAPPKDFTFDSDPPQGQGGGSADGIDAEMVQALAMSMESSGAAPAALEPTAAPPPLAEKAWPPPPGCPEGGASGSVVVRLRLPNGENFTQAFWLEHTLRDLCSIVHHQAGVTLSTSKVRSHTLAAARCGSRHFGLLCRSSLFARHAGALAWALCARSCSCHMHRPSPFVSREGTLFNPATPSPTSTVVSTCDSWQPALHQHGRLVVQLWLVGPGGSHPL